DQQPGRAAREAGDRARLLDRHRHEQQHDGEDGAAEPLAPAPRRAALSPAPARGMARRTPEKTAGGSRSPSSSSPRLRAMRSGTAHAHRSPSAAPLPPMASGVGSPATASPIPPIPHSTKSP